MRRTIIPLLGALFVVGALAPQARAERGKNPLAGQPAVRHKVEMRRLRFEITPQFVVSVNQDFRLFLGGGALLQMHIADWIAIGAQFAGGGAVNTGLTNWLLETLPATEADPNRVPFQPTQQQFQDRLATIRALFSLHATLTPFSGKLALFSALFLRYDFYGMFGFGGMFVTNNFAGSEALRQTCLDPNTFTDPNTCPPENSGFMPGVLFGAGTHVFFNEWLGLNLEFRDYLTPYNAAGADVDGDFKISGGKDTTLPSDRKFQNNLFFSFGLTFMLPPKAKVTH